MPGNRTRLGGGDHRRESPVQGAGPRGRAFGPQVAIVLSTLALAAGSAAADDKPGAASAPLRSVHDLDGLHLFVGPIGAATHVGDTWDSAWGGNVALIRVRERAALGVAGAWIGAAHYGASDGGRIWIEGVAGSRRLLGRMLGAGVGPVLELGEVQHPRLGAQASIWCFAGVVPYARLGVLDASGSFVELGVSLSIPALRF